MTTVSATAAHSDPLLPGGSNTIVQLLVKEGHVSEAQLRHAVRVQKKLETPQPILAILRQQGVTGDAEVRSSLRANPQSMRLGSLLVELGHLRESDLEAALQAQQAGGNKKRLGEVLGTCCRSSA